MKKIKTKGGFIYRTHNKKICARCGKLVSKVFIDRKTHEWICKNCS